MANIHTHKRLRVRARTTPQHADIRALKHGKFRWTFFHHKGFGTYILVFAFAFVLVLSILTAEPRQGRVEMDPLPLLDHRNTPVSVYKEARRTYILIFAFAIVLADARALDRKSGHRPSSIIKY